MLTFLYLLTCSVPHKQDFEQFFFIFSKLSVVFIILSMLFVEFLTKFRQAFRLSLHLFLKTFTAKERQCGIVVVFSPYGTDGDRIFKLKVFVIGIVYYAA
jgi:hypothetical protein